MSARAIPVRNMFLKTKSKSGFEIIQIRFFFYNHILMTFLLSKKSSVFTAKFSTLVLALSTLLTIGASAHATPKGEDLLRAMNLYIIQFASNKYDIPPRNMVFLERASGYMKKLPPNVVVEVGGHTDSAGDNAPNQILSDNRAKAVKAALLAFQIKPEMLTEKGYGEEKPKATNDTEDGKFQNRRIEYTAVKK